MNRRKFLSTVVGASAIAVVPLSNAAIQDWPLPTIVMLDEYNCTFDELMFCSSKCRADFEPSDETLQYLDNARLWVGEPSIKGTPCDGCGVVLPMRRQPVVD